MQQLLSKTKCLHCSYFNEVNMSYIWINPDPIVSSTTLKHQQSFIASFKMEKQALSELTTQCVKCNNNKYFKFFVSEISGNSVENVYPESGAVTVLIFEKIGDKISVGAKELRKGFVSKFMFRTFFLLASKTVSAYDESLFITKNEGFLNCTIAVDAQNNNNTSLINIDFYGFSKAHLLEVINHFQNEFMIKAGMNPNEF